MSGDTKYESCWPAIGKDLHGIIFVYNPDSKSAERDLDTWYHVFAAQAKIKESCMLICAHQGALQAPQFGQAPPKLDRSKLRIRKSEQRARESERAREICVAMQTTVCFTSCFAYSFPPFCESAKSLQKVNVIETSLDHKSLSDRLRSDVDRLLEQIVAARRESEESIVLAE